MTAANRELMAKLAHQRKEFEARSISGEIINQVARPAMEKKPPIDY
jgi:hypothetical protein